MNPEFWTIEMREDIGWCSNGDYLESLEEALAELQHHRDQYPDTEFRAVYYEGKVVNA